MNSLDVGMTELVKEVLCSLFVNAISQHFALTGCSLQLGDRWVRLYAVHSATVADFLALKDVLQSMGQQGLKLCPCCSNIAKADIAEGGTDTASQNCV